MKLSVLITVILLTAIAECITFYYISKTIILENDLRNICNSYVIYKWTADSMNICSRYQDILKP